MFITRKSMQARFIVICLLFISVLCNAEESGDSGSIIDKVIEKSDNKTSDKGEVCYDLVGCFKTGPPWQTALRLCSVPQAPKDLKTLLRFYSKPFPKREHLIYKYPNINIKKIPFRKAKPTYIVIHGSNSGAEDPWVMQVKDGYIKRKDANVITVDWSDLGKSAFPFNQVTVCGSIRTTANEASAVIRALQSQRGLDLSKTHCVGHSVGAQICAYIGKNFTGQLATITGLDAAQPLYETFPASVRLNKGDAKFVMAVHTDGAPFLTTGSVGFMAPYADIDFYFNGGFSQPGCKVSMTKMVAKAEDAGDVIKAVKNKAHSVLSCPHARAHDYWAEAVNSRNCTFWGHKADVQNEMEAIANTMSGGKSVQLTGIKRECKEPTDCSPVGYDTIIYPGRGVYTVTTRGESPYCVNLGEGTTTEEKPQLGSALTSFLSGLKDYFK